MAKKIFSLLKVGRKPQGVKSGQSYSLKTKCNELTVGDYIRMICEGNTDVLVIKGKPGKDVVNEAKMSVLQDFAELSGAGEGEPMKIYGEIAKYREDLLAITETLNLFSWGLDDEQRDRAYKILDACGVSTRSWPEYPTEKEFKRASSYVKSIEVRMREKIEYYNKLVSKNEGNPVTEMDIRLEISAIADRAGRTIGDDYNLAAYAVDKKRHIDIAKALEAQEQLKGKR